MSFETGGIGGASKEAVSNLVNLIESMFSWIYNWWWSIVGGGDKH